MATEKFANSASSTLLTPIGSGDLSILVASAIKFPTQPQFRVLIENEIMLVTGVGGPVFTVSRGVEGTTATSHGAGLPVKHILTAGAIAQLQADVPRPAGAFLPLVSGIQVANATTYVRLGALPAINYANTGVGTPLFQLRAVIDIPASSTAQLQLYDVTNHAAVWTSGVISGPQTDYSISQTVTLASGSILLELWMATPTDTGGDAVCLSAGILASFT
jgi:hypothetical protein